MIHPARDVEGLKPAALEYFVEGMEAPELERAVRRAAMTETDELLKLQRPRALAAGYYDWVSYLLWLEAMRAAGIDFALLAVEVNGLVAVRAARREFEERYPRCDACGRNNQKYVKCRCGGGVKA